MTLAKERPLVTKRQRQILDEVGRFYSEHGYCTSVRELMHKFDFSSTNAVVCNLRALQRKGLVTWEPGIARTLRPTGDIT